MSDTDLTTAGGLHHSRLDLIAMNDQDRARVIAEANMPASVPPSDARWGLPLMVAATLMLGGVMGLLVLAWWVFR